MQGGRNALQEVVSRQEAVVALAEQPDVMCADLLISPSRRIISGPLGQVSVEPRAMQLLVVLLEAADAVVSREVLSHRVWGGIIVGDDALSRAVALARRSLREAGTAALQIETIPKVGYRLAGAAAAAGAASSAPDVPGSRDATGSWPRRGLLAGLAGAGAALLGAGWLALRDRPTNGIEPSLAEADRILQQGGFDPGREARALLERSVAADPGNARAWGLLAVAWATTAGGAVPETLAEAEQHAETAIGKALALDRLQGDALAARAILLPGFGNWLVVEERLKRALDIAPDNPHALARQIGLLMSVGRIEEAEQAASRLLALNPRHDAAQLGKAQALWAREGADSAQRFLEQSGRAPDILITPWLQTDQGKLEDAEALVMAEQRKQRAPSHVLSGHLKTFRAIRTGDPADREAARDALNALSRLGGTVTSVSLSGFARLGMLDEAFEVADRWYGAAVRAPRTAAGRATLHRTGTRTLFQPATAPLRRDPRFLPLCARIGLADYWRRSNRRADFLMSQLLPL